MTTEPGPDSFLMCKSLAGRESQSLKHTKAISHILIAAEYLLTSKGWDKLQNSRSFNHGCISSSSSGSLGKTVQSEVSVFLFKYKYGFSWLDFEQVINRSRCAACALVPLIRIRSEWTVRNERLQQ